MTVTEEKTFPRTEIEGVSVSRMLIGTNWLLGWSHTGAAADAMIKQKYDCAEKMVPVLSAYLENGVDTLMGPVSEQPELIKAIRLAEEKCEKKIIIVDTPIINVGDSDIDRAEAKEQFQRSKDCGATFSLIHHASIEQLVNKHKAKIERIGDYTGMIRDLGMIPGASAHMPEIVIYSDANNYDIQTYIQIYNAMGFLMQVEVETVAKIIHAAKHPVMTIKPMAAGRCTPFVGFNFTWNTIRDCDMVTVGAHTEAEVLEDIEISKAALERRLPNIAKRSSPDVHQAAFGNL